MNKNQDAFVLHCNIIPYYVIKKRKHTDRPMVFFVASVSFQVPTGLPERRYVTINSSDAALITRWIDNKLGPTAMKGQRHNLTTNRCEAAHLSVLKGCPKCRNRTRNFAGRAKSAIHSVSVGSIESVITTNRLLGAENLDTCPAYRTRQQLKKQEQFHKERRKSLLYRASKYAGQSRARRMRQHHGSATGYSTGVDHPVVCHDHSYNT